MAQSIASVSETPTSSNFGSGFSELFRFVGQKDERAFKFLLILRFILINTTALFIVILLWQQGWLGQIIDGQSFKLLAIIVGVFLFGLFWCGQKIVTVSHELNTLSHYSLRVESPNPGSRVSEYLTTIEGLDAQSRANIAMLFRMKIATRTATIRHIASSLVILGLIGTVIGFMIALSGVDPDVVSDISAVGPMVSTLITGMSVALYTTLVGAVLNVWLMVNYRLLEGGTVSFYTKLVAIGERHAGI